MKYMAERGYSVTEAFVESCYDIPLTGGVVTISKAVHPSRNRINSRRYGFNSLRCDVQRASHRPFAEITQAGAGALTDLEGGVFWTERKRLVELAVKSRLPAVYARPLGGRLPSTQCPPKRGAE